MGVDGLPYEIKGEAHRMFNLFTSPGVSLNAHFLSVPDAFRAEDITETVLGSVHVLACGLRGEQLSVHFDVATGNLSVSVSGDPGNETNPQPSRGRAAVAAALGVRLILERYVCDMRRMDCVWEDITVESPETKLPKFELGSFSRLKLRTACPLAQRVCHLYKGTLARPRAHLLRAKKPILYASRRMRSSL